MNRRRFLLSALAAPAVITTAGLLMPVRKPIWAPEPAVHVLMVGPGGLLRVLDHDEYTTKRIQLFGEPFADAKVYAVTLRSPPAGDPQFIASARDGALCYIEPYIIRNAA